MLHACRQVVGSANNPHYKPWEDSLPSLWFAHALEKGLSSRISSGHWSAWTLEDRNKYLNSWDLHVWWQWKLQNTGLWWCHHHRAYPSCCCIWPASWFLQSCGGDVFRLLQAVCLTSDTSANQLLRGIPNALSPCRQQGKPLTPVPAWRSQAPPLWACTQNAKLVWLRGNRCVFWLGGPWTVTIISAFFQTACVSVYKSFNCKLRMTSPHRSTLCSLTLKHNQRWTQLLTQHASQADYSPVPLGKERTPLPVAKGRVQSIIHWKPERQTPWEHPIDSILSFNSKRNWKLSRWIDLFRSHKAD